MNQYQNWDVWADGFGAAQQGANVQYGLHEQALRQLRSQGLTDEQAIEVIRHRSGRQSNSGLGLWDPTQLQQRPQWQGPPAYSMDNGFGYDAETTARSNQWEDLLVEQRNKRLNQVRTPAGPHIQPGFAESSGLVPPPQMGRPGPHIQPGFAESSGLVGMPQIGRPGPHIQPGFAESSGLVGMPQMAIDRSDPWGNDARINSTLASPLSQPQRRTSAGPVLDPLTAGVTAADVAANVLPLTQSAAAGMPNVSGGGAGTSTAQGVDTIDRQMARRGGPARIALLGSPPPSPHIQPGFVESSGLIDMPPPGGRPGPHIQPGFVESSGLIDMPQSGGGGGGGGGGGTSTAQGADAVARQAAKRGRGGRGGGFAQAVDSFATNPAQSIGVASERGMRNVAAALHRRGLPGLAGMAKKLAPVARWAAPTAAFGGAFALPAITGALSGNETAGAAGAALQGGSALAGAAIGQALVPIPFVGAAIGSMAGNAVGGGLASSAANLVEKSQAGDTGFMGSIGQALDPFVDTAFEKEQKAVMQQMNSPAMRVIQDQEKLREAKARAQQTEHLLMQSYMQVV